MPFSPDLSAGDTNLDHFMNVVSLMSVHSRVCISSTASNPVFPSLLLTAFRLWPLGALEDRLLHPLDKPPNLFWATPPFLAAREVPGSFRVPPRPGLWHQPLLQGAPVPVMGQGCLETKMVTGSVLTATGVLPPRPSQCSSCLPMHAYMCVHP